MIDVEVRVGNEESTVELRVGAAVTRENVRVEVALSVVVVFELVDAAAVEFKASLEEVALTSVSAVLEAVTSVKVW